MAQQTIPPTSTLLELEQKPKLSINDKLIFVLPLISGSMLGAALPNIISETGASGNFKIVLATVGSMLVGYGVTRIAVKSLAPLFAKGYKLAGAVSLGALAAVGFGFAGASIAGFTATDVAERQVQANGTELSQFMAEKHEIAIQASRAAPTLGFVSGDLQQWAQCEFRENCISHAAVTGAGSITTILQGKADDATLIADEFERGEQAREQALADMNAHYEEYQRTLGKTEISIWERRFDLELIHNTVIQSAAKLAEAVPVTLVDQFGQELTEGVSIPGRSDVERRLNSILRENGERIEGVLEDVEQQDLLPPIFPEKPGVSTILTFLPKHIPLAILIVMIDLIFPMMLFVMTWLDARWKIEQEKFHRRQAQNAVATIPSSSKQKQPQQRRNSNRNHKPKIHIQVSNKPNGRAS